MFRRFPLSIVSLFSKLSRNNPLNLVENLQKLLDWLKGFPAWARVVILVLIAAIFAIVSLTSCAAQAKMQRSGVHIDTVRVDYIIRSRNIQNF